MFTVPRPLIAAALAVLAVAGCSRESAPQVGLSSPDSAYCKRLLAEPASQGCNLMLEFGPVDPAAGPTRRAAAEAWFAAHSQPGIAVRTQQGGQGSARVCVTTPFERDTDATYEALKPIAESSAAGLMRICTDTGHSIVASDPVDHGGDEVKS